jgi:hypothetical protein
MKKNTQILVGVAILGIGGYLYWKSKQPKKTFANLASKTKPKFSCPAGKQMYSDDGGVNSFFCIDPRGYKPAYGVTKVNV